MKTRILFIIYSIYGGGAERQMQYILKYIDRKKFEPHLVIFHITGKEKEVLTEDVPIYDLSTKLRPASFFLVFKLVNMIKKVNPDKIVSFMWSVNLISIMASLLTCKKVIAVERTFPLRSLEGYSCHYIRKFIYSWLYCLADKIVVNSRAVEESLIENFKIPKAKIIKTSNGIDLDEIKQKEKGEIYDFPEGEYILSVGHLEKVKNYRFLLDVVSEVAKISKNTLVILGKGSQRKFLEEKASRLGIDLILPGHKENPYPWFKKAEIFVLTSKYEGFPNVILEAMVCGVPIVAVDCPGGVGEIIKDGKNGLLVPQNNKIKMKEAIQKILNIPHFAKELSEKAKEDVCEYDVYKMVKKYEDILS